MIKKVLLLYRPLWVDPLLELKHELMEGPRAHQAATRHRKRPKRVVIKGVGTPKPYRKALALAPF